MTKNPACPSHVWKWETCEKNSNEGFLPLAEPKTTVSIPILFNHRQPGLHSSHCHRAGTHSRLRGNHKFAFWFRRIGPGTTRAYSHSK